MKYSLVGELPRHLYCYVDSRYTHNEPQGFIPAVWFGLVSYPGRTWGCTVMLQSGAIYRNVPAHGIAFSLPTPTWTPKEVQTWNCYGEDFTCLEYSYLSGLKCKVKANDREFLGSYLFTAAPVGDGFSAYPEQAKEFCFIELENGRLTIQPTNHVLFQEISFTDPTFEWPRGLQRQTHIYSAE